MGKHTPISLYFQKLTKNATLPTQGSSGAAGYDLYSAESNVLKARDKILIMTDIAVAIWSGYYGRIAPRSGLTLKHGLDVGAGVIDSDYRGNIGVILFNHTDKDYKITKGDRIAQLIVIKITTPPIEEVGNLSTTKRGNDGFGSTGYNDNNKKKIKK